MIKCVIYIQRTPELNAAPNIAINIFKTATIALNQQILKHICLSTQIFSVKILSICHRGVDLFACGSPRTKTTSQPESIFETGMGIYLRVLCLAPNDSKAASK